MNSIPDTLYQNLRHPTWISTIASIGIHGILGIVLPFLPQASSRLTEPGIPRPVSLVELTPEQQSRLPDFSTPQISLPSVPPSNPDIYALTPLPNPFTTIPTPLPLPSFSIPPFFIPPPPLSARRPPQPSPSRAPTPTPPPTPSNTPAQTEPSPSPTQFGPIARVPELGNLNPTRNQREPNLPGKNPNVASGNPSPNPTQQPSPPTPSEQTDQQQLLTYNPEGTDPDLVYAPLSEWSRSVSESVQTELENLDVTAPYPKEACEISPKPQGTAVIGVVVNAEGRVVNDPAEPELFLSSGYPLFNQQAIELVKNYEFDATGQSQVYLVSVKFEYKADACASSETSETPPSPTPPSN